MSRILSTGGGGSLSQHAPHSWGESVRGGGSLSGERGLSGGGLCPGGSLLGRMHSYWNAFLLFYKYFNHANWHLEVN